MSQEEKTQQPAKGAAASKQQATGWSAEEQAAMKARAKEMKAEAQKIREALQKADQPGLASEDKAALGELEKAAQKLEKAIEEARMSEAGQKASEVGEGSGGAALRLRAGIGGGVGRGVAAPARVERAVDRCVGRVVVVACRIVGCPGVGARSEVEVGARPGVSTARGQRHEQRAQRRTHAGSVTAASGARHGAAVGMTYATSTPGPSGSPIPIHSTSSTVHAMPNATEYGTIAAINVPRPASRSYCRANTMMIAM